MGFCYQVEEYFSIFKRWTAESIQQICNPFDQIGSNLIALRDICWMPTHIFVQLDLERCLYCWFVTEKEIIWKTNLAAWVSGRERSYVKMSLARN